MFGSRKRRERQERELANRLASDAPNDRLFAAMHAGAQVVVDGDAVATHGWPQASTPEQRKALVHFCEAVVGMHSSSQATIRVFFDASLDKTVPRSKTIAIELTEDRNAAAEQAIQAIEAGRASVGVWSADPNAVSLRAAGAIVCSPDDLLDGFLDLGS